MHSMHLKESLRMRMVPKSGSRSFSRIAKPLTVTCSKPLSPKQTVLEALYGPLDDETCRCVRHVE